MKEKLELISEVKGNKQALIAMGFIKTISQLVNIGFIALIVYIMMIVVNQADIQLISWLIIGLALVFLKISLVLIEGKLHGYASGNIKVILRNKIFAKLRRIGFARQSQVDQSFLTQISTEGVDQLDLYYTLFIPQMIYGSLTPIIVLVILAFINIYAAILLFVSIPLIPLIIIVINKKAKKKLGKYWDSYASMGKMFFDFLKGINTIKVFNADNGFHKEMNQKAESFRLSTMKVLKMQLNSITIMDLIAYGGAALAIMIIGLAFQAQDISIWLALFAVVLSADFFLPLRSLGSAFHVATNGMAAYEKMKDFLAIEEGELQEGVDLIFGQGISFEYRSVSLRIDNNQILDKISLRINDHGLHAIIGESGSGKTTLARLLLKTNQGYEGRILVNDIDIREYQEMAIISNIIYVNSDNYLLSGSVREILSNGFSDVLELRMWDVLNSVGLAEFFRSKDEGLEYLIEKNGSNLSGGQKERLLIAKALLVDASVYIFDEPTSSVDYENEQIILKLISDLAKTKSVILITHKLSALEEAEVIFLLAKGSLVTLGTHDDLLEKSVMYQERYQKELDLNQWRQL